MSATATTSRLATPAEVLNLVRWAGVVALDLETTGLDPRRDRIRLLSLSDGNRALVLDCFEHDVRQVLPWLASKTLLIHHAAFDLAFLWQAGLTEPPETVCTYLLSKLVDGSDTPRGWHGLGGLTQRRLGTGLNKELQTSDWSGPLSDDQLAYAAADAAALPALFRSLAQDLDRHGLVRVSDVELRALPAFVWLRAGGVPFDRDGWEVLAARAAGRKQQLEGRLEEIAPARGGPGLFGVVDHWNWDSPKQVQAVLHQLGFSVATTNDAQLALIDHPFAECLRDHRHQAQLVKMYGANWLASAALAGGRVYPEWQQLGTDTGRTACERPNMQQVPRDEDPDTKQAVYRACVRAEPGQVLVKSDYATLQMRIACKWARDKALYDVFARGLDPHTHTAQRLLGKPEVTKADRQIAKSANFGLLFGMSAEGLRVYAKMTFGVDFSAAEAERHRANWFKAYPGLARWHAETRQRRVPETRCASGRRRVLPDHAPDTWRLNSPVQGDEADGLKLALALLWERRRQCPDARPVLAVHDEIVVECPEGQAEAVKAWVEAAMLDGMSPWLDPVPCQVDAKVVKTWGG